MPPGSAVRAATPTGRGGAAARHVERVDVTGHRDPDGQIRAGEGPPAQPVALGTQDQRQTLRRLGGQLVEA